MKLRRNRTLLLGLAAIIPVLACSTKEPTQAIAFNNGRLNIQISDKWVVQRETNTSMTLRHPELGDVRLSIEDQTRDYGAPMSTPAVRSAIGTELNLAYGGVDARLSYGGNAVLRYPREIEEGGTALHSENWVVAKPVGYSAVARIAITLKVPAGEQGSPAIAKLIESLDKQIGDAKISA